MVAFELLWIKIYWYGIFYLLAFLVAYLFLNLVKKTDFLKSNQKLYNLFSIHLDDLLFYSFIWVLVWGRLWYVLIYDLQYFLHNPLEIFMIWHWGMSFVGWVIWVSLMIYFFTKNKWFTKSEYLYIMDIIVAILPFGIMIWRLWNFLNQELYGKVITDLIPNISDKLLSILSWVKLIYIYKTVDFTYRINSNLIEWLFEWFLLLVVLQVVFWKKIRNFSLKPWYISGMFLIIYWLVRFFAEFLRFSPFDWYIAFFTKSQALMLLFIVGGILLLKRIKYIDSLKS